MIFAWIGKKLSTVGTPQNKKSEIGIVFFFESNGGGWTMTRIDHRFVGQDHQIFLNARDQCLMIASGQIGPANALAKQHIAHNAKTIGSRIIHHAAR